MRWARIASAVLLTVFLLASCDGQGRIEVLTPTTEGETETRRTVEDPPGNEPPDGNEIREWIIHVQSRKFHASEECQHVKNMLPVNRETKTASALELIAEGGTPCTRCAEEYAVFLPQE